MVWGDLSIPHDGWKCMNYVVGDMSADMCTDAYAKTYVHTRDIKTFTKGNRCFLKNTSSWIISFPVWSRGIINMVVSFYGAMRAER